MSYGGSSVLVTFIALGLLQSIYIQARMSAAGKGRALLTCPALPCAPGATHRPRHACAAGLHFARAAGCAAGAKSEKD